MGEATVEDLYRQLAALQRENEELRAKGLAELELTNARLQLALEASQMAVFEWDIVNDRIESIFAGRLISRHGSLISALEQSIAPDHRDRITRLIREALHDPTCERLDLEYQAFERDSLRWRAAEMRLLRDETGRALRLVGASMDINDKKLLELRLATAERLESLGRLAGGIAHDFNNLLTVILSSLSQVHSAGHGTEEALADIRDAAERARRLTRQLLAFARRQPMTRRPVDLGALLRDACKWLARVLGDQIELVLAVTDDVVMVHADPGQLEQVVLNLATNARDAMPAGGSLRIELACVDAHAVVRVADSGVGMDERTRELAFEPFFTTKPAGTGLGLATTYGIITQLGGEIAVRSAPGEGTTVEVRLPVIEAMSLAVPAAATHVQRGRETLLLVDDDASVRRALCRALRKDGYQVVEASSAREALELVHDGVALLVTDVMMPRMSGAELAARIRERHPQIRILFVSGYTDEDVASAPRTMFLPKPFDVTELLRTVRRLLDE